MSKNLLVVESPAKAKTLKKYLGDHFEVLASYGHVRDLIPKEGAVDPEHDFAMHYQPLEKNEKYFKGIAKAAAQAEVLYLATDPDREGEAISWHLCELLKVTLQQGLNSKTIYRVVFYEITQRAVQEALQHPRALSMPLINAQQARRALDYLVGFNLSPLLWKKISPGLSAGRVQSPALRLIVEREEAIEQFKTQEYWTLAALVDKASTTFTAKLVEYQNVKVTPLSFTDASTAHTVQATLQQHANGQLQVLSLDKKQRRRHPTAPFITSTLQQEASRQLGFAAARTMRIAQQLYEGVDVGSGSVGLITYMRTDSTHLAQEAVAEIRSLIQQRYGAHSLPAEPRQFKTKAKNAQEAHEAIRPTNVHLTPDTVRSALSDDQYRLYELIWKRTVACQMTPAVFDVVIAELAGGPGNVFRASGSTRVDAGFMVVYQEGVDEGASTEELEQTPLPPLIEGESLLLKEITADQHFTEPPPRYSEASLVKSLEELGIGRPSTYASIIETLQQRGYAFLDRRRFYPTDMGRVVNHFLTQHFTKYVDYDFTARLEDDLDAVSRGEQEWIPLLHQFWTPFHEQVVQKNQLSREELVADRVLGVDPASGQPVIVRVGRYGAFVQIGHKENGKPRFAGLRPHQRMHTITLEEALALFQLPRLVGTTPTGDAITANIGRFGPYLHDGKKFIPLKEDDPYTIEQARALAVIAAYEEVQANKVIQTFADSPIQILQGRYGPYITDGQKNARIPKDCDPKTLTQADCEQRLAQAPETKRRRGDKKATTTTAKKATKTTSTKPIKAAQKLSALPEMQPSSADGAQEGGQEGVHPVVTEIAQDRSDDRANQKAAPRKVAVTVTSKAASTAAATPTQASSAKTTSPSPAARTNKSPRTKTKNVS